MALSTHPLAGTHHTPGGGPQFSNKRRLDVNQKNITNNTPVLRIHMFLGLPVPDLLIVGMDPDPGSIIMQNSKKNLDFYYFVTLFDFLPLKNDINVPSKSNKQKKLFKKVSFLLAS
jgi:hypothetical protein